MERQKDDVMILEGLEEVEEIENEDINSEDHLHFWDSNSSEGPRAITAQLQTPLPPPPLRPSSQPLVFENGSEVEVSVEAAVPSDWFPRAPDILELFHELNSLLTNFETRSTDPTFNFYREICNGNIEVPYFVLSEITPKAFAVLRGDIEVPTVPEPDRIEPSSNMDGSLNPPDLETKTDPSPSLHALRNGKRPRSDSIPHEQDSACAIPPRKAPRNACHSPASFAEVLSLAGGGAVPPKSGPRNAPGKAPRASSSVPAIVLPAQDNNRDTEVDDDDGNDDDKDDKDDDDEHEKDEREAAEVTSQRGKETRPRAQCCARQTEGQLPNMLARQVLHD